MYCVYREQGRRQIERELSVCPECKEILDSGFDLYRLRAMRGSNASVPEVCAVDETGAKPKIVPITVKGPLSNPVILKKPALKRVF